MSIASSQRLWTELARRWAELGPPLRPCDVDVAFYARAVSETSATNGAPGGLILGVTPELYQLPWPKGSRLLAADRSGPMIESIWPGPRSRVVQADWTALPLPDRCCNVALCDGGTLQLPYPDGLQRLVASLERVIVPGGRCAIRFFCAAASPETPATVLADLLAGRIPSMNHLKLRFATALQSDSACGVELGEVWQQLAHVAPNATALAECTGWSIEHIQTIDAYRNQRTRYHFLTTAQIEQLFCGTGRFTIDRIDVPGYTLGQQCPIFHFRRR